MTKGNDPSVQTTVALAQQARAALQKLLSRPELSAEAIARIDRVMARTRQIANGLASFDAEVERDAAEKLAEDPKFDEDDVAQFVEQRRSIYGKVVAAGR